MSTGANPSNVSKTSEDKILETTQQFWSKNSKWIVGLMAVVILGTAGYIGYDKFVKAPAEAVAQEAIWSAEANFKTDSFKLALNGDGTKNNPGFLKVITKHSGTKSANLAHFYAGICYLQLGEFANAVKHLQDFSTNDPVLLMRKYGSLADAYAEQGKTEDAIQNYRKAATAFETDEANSSEYLFRLAQLYDKLGKTQEAIESFNALKEKFPLSLRANDVDKYLARLGVTQ